MGKGAHERNPKQARISEGAEGEVRGDPWLTLVKDVRTFYLKNLGLPTFREMRQRIKIKPSKYFAKVGIVAESGN